MHHNTFKHWLAAATAFLAASVLILWSWNTIVEPFQGPAIQYKHALAVTGLLGLLRWTFSGRGGRRGIVRDPVHR